MNVDVARRSSIREFFATLRAFWLHGRDRETPTASRLELARRASAQLGMGRPMPRPGAEGKKRGAHVTAAVLKMVSRRTIKVVGSIPS